MNPSPNSMTYEEWLTERLQDPNELELYLSAALEVFQEDFSIDTLESALNYARRASYHYNHVSPHTTMKLEHISKLVELFQDKHPPPRMPDALFAIKCQMEETGLSRKDLQPCFGSYQKTLKVLSGKRALTLSMARSLHNTFDIPAEALLGKRGVSFNPNVDLAKLKLFPWKEIISRGWVTHWSDWKDRTEEMFNELFRIEQNSTATYSTLLRKTEKQRINSKTDLYAIQAWCLRVMNRANQNPTPNSYQSGTVTTEFMRKIARLSVHADGPRRAQESLSDAGINLVIEHHLPKTYLDGAALRLSDGQPVIGLTLRHDRLDNFWFTLMHELAHIGLHLDQGSGDLFVDELSISPSESREREADNCAREALIPSTLWDSSTARDTMNPLDAYHLSQKAGVHLAVVAGRIRFENNEYNKLSQFVGQGEVKSLFSPTP